MRPFPQAATGTGILSEQWTNYRKAMIDYAGIAVFLFGNKRDPASGGITPLQRHAGGIRPVCRARRLSPSRWRHGLHGARAMELMNRDLTKFYPAASPEFTADFGNPGRHDQDRR